MRWDRRPTPLRYDTATVPGEAARHTPLDSRRNCNQGSDSGRWPEVFWKVASLWAGQGGNRAQRYQSVGIVGVVEFAGDGVSG
jgi:hypothetical protein